MKREIKVITRAVAKEHKCEPRFYVIGGSDIYGFKSEAGSDIDVRGFHTAKSDGFFEVERVKEQIIINQDGLTEGYEKFSEIELVSYELRKFGKLITVMNFNILEWLYHGKVVMNGEPMLMDKLRDELKQFLPHTVPFHYMGMAKQNYHKFLNRENSECYRPTAKKFLYVIRGLLGAKYVAKYKDIQSDIRVLSKRVLDGNDIIDRLIEIKQKHENQRVPTEVENKGRDLILELMDMKLKKIPTKDKKLINFVNDWMKEVRRL